MPFPISYHKIPAKDRITNTDIISFQDKQILAPKRNQLRKTRLNGPTTIF